MDNDEVYVDFDNVQKIVAPFGVRGLPFGFSSRGHRFIEVKVTFLLSLFKDHAIYSWFIAEVSFTVLKLFCMYKKAPTKIVQPTIATSTI